jgi:hypothetical protein
MQRDPELVAFVERMYDVFATGSPDVVAGMIASDPEVLGIGTDPAEWWVGDAVEGAFRAQMPQMHAAGMRFRAGAIQAYREGSIGWVADQPALEMPDGNRLPMRMTLVCRRDGDAWRMLQFHLSIGARNEDALGTELTI